MDTATGASMIIFRLPKGLTAGEYYQLKVTNIVGTTDVAGTAMGIDIRAEPRCLWDTYSENIQTIPYRDIEPHKVLKQETGGPE